MSWIDIINGWRIIIIVGALADLIFALYLLPQFRTTTQYMITTGMFALVLAAATSEIDRLGTSFDSYLLANTIGIVFIGIGFVMIRRDRKNASRIGDRLP